MNSDIITIGKFTNGGLNVGLIIFILSMFSCYTDYRIGDQSEDRTIREQIEVEVLVEVPVEVEVPVYVEVEVPVNEGIIWVDSFTQHMSVDGIDIIWVIDRSGSMATHNDRLIAGVEAMMTALPTADWRLVMISADPRNSVVSTEFPLVPGDDAEDARDMLATLTTAPFEEGFNSVYDYIVLNPYSGTWMRPEAGLLVVFVSDEDEQSNVEYPAVSDFMSWYQSMRMGSVFMASVINIESEDSLCGGWVPAHYVGKRYREATNMLGGVVLDICSEDWTPGVTDATHSIEPYEQLTLTHQAEEDSIRVFVDGVLNHDWYYQESDNTVYFTIIPSAGSLVEVGYRYIELDTGVTDSGS